MRSQRREIIPQPAIIEKTPYGERHLDIWTKLLQSRIVFLGASVDDAVADILIGQLLYLEQDDPDKDIQMYINSPGGEIDGTLAIYDTMQLLKPDVSTNCIGMCASGAALLLAAGAKGKRYALPHSRVMIHQAWGGAGGQAADVEIRAKELLRQNEVVREILAHHTGQPLERIVQDTDRDFFMNAEAAKEYGIIDEVLVGGELAEIKGGDSAKK